MDDNAIKNLINEAVNAKKNAYAPYSNFKVGAALLTESGKIFTGCNIENSAYSPSNCAERTAFFKAVSEGVRDFKAIAIVCDKGEFCSPCGVCRQVMTEFCDSETFSVILADGKNDFKIVTLKELIPLAFKFNK